MDCEQRAHLRIERDEAAMALDIAREILGERIGNSSKEEFLLLDRAADDAWDKLQLARRALDQHLRNHGCAATAAEASSRVLADAR